MALSCGVDSPGESSCRALGGGRPSFACLEDLGGDLDAQGRDKDKKELLAWAGNARLVGETFD